MGLFYEFVFEVSLIRVMSAMCVPLMGRTCKITKRKDVGKFSLPRDRADYPGVWANGDDVGYSFHGGFFPLLVKNIDP